MKCSTHNCSHEATCFFCWPGRKQQGACTSCGERARKVAAALGFELELTFPPREVLIVVLPEPSPENLS